MASVQEEKWSLGSRFNDYIKERSVAALLVVLIVVCLATGLLIGSVLSDLSNQKYLVEKLDQEYEITQIYVRNLEAKMIANSCIKGD